MMLTLKNSIWEGKLQFAIVTFKTLQSSHETLCLTSCVFNSAFLS